MSDNEEDVREGSDGETTGEGSTQPRDPETGRFLPSDGTVGIESAQHETENDGGDEDTERERSANRGSRGVITLGRPQASGKGPTHRIPDSQPVTVHLRRAERAEQHTGAAIVPPEVLQTSTEREFPPWLAKPPEDETESNRGDGDREFWEAPVDPQDERAAVRQGRRGLERLQPERQATRQPPDPSEGAPQPGDGQPRQQSRADRGVGVVHPTELPPFLMPSRPEAVVPALARRHQIGRWLQRGRDPTESELPPHRRPIADRQGSSGPRVGVDRYSEPQEVRVGPTPPQQHEQWEYATSRPDLPTEKWEAAWGDDEPGPGERGQWGLAHAEVERTTGREGSPPQREPDRSNRGGREGSSDGLIRPGPT